jgi:glycosyltransferase involved in cell wall biosynthesis
MKINPANICHAKRILVVAGAVVAINEAGEYVTKNPMANYLHQLADSFDRCTWVANRYTGNDYGGVLDTNKIRVVIVESGWVARFKSWIQMLRLALEHEYVIYYLPNPYLPILPLIRLRARRLIVYLAGDYEVNIQWYKHQRWPGWATLFRWSFEGPMQVADAVIARGKKLAKMASRFNTTIYETVPLGHISFAGPAMLNGSDKLKEDTNYRVLFVGKIVESKGVGDLLTAFNQLSARFPDVDINLDFVGEGADRIGYERTVRELGINDRVTFHGWVSSSEQIGGYFNQADLVVVPSIYPEGVPRVIDEAIVRGVPVVATPVGGIGEEFSNGEIFLVKENAPAELSAAIEKMLFDGEARNQHLAQAALRSELFRRFGSAAKQHVMILLDQIGLKTDVER